MEARSEFKRMVMEGIHADLFLALESRHLFEEIGTHAEQINASSFMPVFAVLQGYASTNFILAITRLLERAGNRYALQSVEGTLTYLKAHQDSIPLAQPIWLEQVAERFGYPSAFASTPYALIDMLLQRLPHHEENDALDKLKRLRDKRIAHPEQIAADSIAPATWESAVTLLKIPREALAVCGAYLSTGYVDNLGALLMESEAQRAASATRRTLRELKITSTET
jgi:hypothetical protein